MKNIVITGSTRGIGFGLADAFLAEGCQVVINGRSQESVDQACAQLAKKHMPDLLHGFKAVVSDPAQAAALWQFAKQKLDTVDIWINNAGLGHDTEPFWDIPTHEARSVIEVNVLGVTYGSQEAMRGMFKQGKGQIYNMEGFGSNGRHRYGMSLYGTSKAAVRYLTDAMVEETKDSNILVGALSPGMVMTDLVLDRFKEDPAELEKRKRIFNIIADSVDNVAPWLVQRILSNEKHGARIDYMPPAKMAGRFMTSPFSKRDLFAEKREMMLEIKQLTEEQIRIFVSWEYSGPYIIYNMSGENMESQVHFFSDPENGYFAITDGQDELLGFCNFGADARVPIAEFNRRALRLCLKFGFSRISRFTREGDGKPFVIMIRDMEDGLSA